MRVVAGALRGRRLQAPPGVGTRPTSDRVREATFNALGSLDAVADADVLDLFAGSGALGIEALSRGAARATFVERDRAALAVLRSNLDACGLGSDRATVVPGDGPELLRTGRLDGPWHLALLDPPYDFDGWEPLLASLDAELAVCESGRPVEPAGAWLVVREKAYGGTVVSVMRREGGDRQGEKK
ncbi:MAG: 16S rRNA (guanine(966)-N(2))-methyltransferase RsmD [Acidimicrobiia bacterium]|nr:16S rRNA (guanine(966)-N(2))-methyltransferase RsmD [Acidimicrobiia bacterium]